MANIIFRAARNKAVQIVVFTAIVVSFVFVGTQSYVSAPAGQDTVAQVGKQLITAAEFDEALRRQQDRLRSMLGSNYDPRMFDTKEARTTVVDELINQKLLLAAASSTGAKVSDAALAERIAAEVAFHDNGKFSNTKYTELLKLNNSSQRNYEASVRRDMERTLFVDAVSRTAFSNSVSTRLLANALEQSREVSLVTLAPEQYLSKLKTDAAAVKAYYDNNKAEFSIPEQVRFEYVELSLDGLAAAETIGDDEVKAYYDATFAGKYQEKLAARKKAEEVLARVKKEPKRFSELAREYSQDLGSSQNGGSLGYFGRGAMVKPFEETVFGKLKVEQISELVESDFGFHIIKLTGIKPKGKDSEEQREASHILINAPKEGKSFEVAKAEIERDLKRQRAGKRFVEVAQIFSDRVFEQSTALKPIAEQLKLQLRVSPWMSKGTQLPPFNNPKLSQALFSDDVLKNKRNTEAVEIASNVLIAARVAELKPAEVRPFAAVEADLTRRLTREEAGKLARADGAEKLKSLQAGTDTGLQWPAPLSVSRQNTGALPPQVLEQAMKATTMKLPTYVGVDGAQGGYVLVKISKVIESPQIDDAKLASLQQRIDQAASQEELLALLTNLRKDEDVKIRTSAIEKKPE